MIDTKRVMGNRLRPSLGFFAPPVSPLLLTLSMVLGALSVACSSRSSSPTVPTLPTPPSSPTAPAGKAPTSRPQRPATTPAQPAHESADAPEKGADAETNGETAPSSGESMAPPEPAAAGTIASEPRTTEEQREALDGDLDSSLSEFDRMLLREQEILAEEQAAQAAASGAGSAGSGGVSYGGSRGEEAAIESADAAGASGDSPDTPPGEASEAGAPVGGKDQAKSENGRIPPDVGDGRDDDIVARQLREAAMNEEDPALREKLWEEYRAYKNGTTRGDN